MTLSIWWAFLLLLSPIKGIAVHVISIELPERTPFLNYDLSLICCEGRAENSGQGHFSCITSTESLTLNELIIDRVKIWLDVKCVIWIYYILCATLHNALWTFFNFISSWICAPRSFRRDNSFYANSCFCNVCAGSK